MARDITCGATSIWPCTPARPAAAFLVELAGFAGAVGGGTCADVLALLIMLWTVALPPLNWPASCESDRQLARGSTILALSPAVVLAGRPSTA